MKGKTLKYIILLATISIAGVFFIQFAFIRYSYRLSEKQFTESASVALKEVAWQIMLATGTTSNFESITPVEVISDNTYLVNVGVLFDRELLVNNLEEQLKKHDIYYGFEFAMFNPQEEQMDEGTLINTDGKVTPSFYSFPTNGDYTYYFAIHFTDRRAYFNSRLSIWYFLTGLLVLVVFFFGYTLSVIIRQRQLSEVQKNFINNLTHELKTPISSIALSAKVLTEKNITETPERLHQYAQIILNQNARLTKNVEKVLNLASLEKSRIKLNSESIDLKSFIEKNCELFRQSDNGQKLNIEIDFKDLRPVITADKFHFANLLSNILENAAKYCEASPQIQITLKKGKNYLALDFADNGIGIAKEHRKKIFKKFYRVPTGNVHNVKGFGLGLDYVYKIVKAHRWKIHVSENPKGGSIFTIIISE
ncbi:HAMP domain-containing sensor histidine kinase [Maribellus sp. YY47]|uniref:sensor histidine kinase n=1 Tax=Maribellus sp. YY47 TaxID=2929486 RepID=UPI002001A8AA|nr:HAMP domain-containing sensor histidine kinase [Maribellus sp. YY47]MCK3684649.1 HAMP domain-containing histidine kinase [Maribellus sp. YY47]